MPTQSIDLCDFLTELELVQYLEPIRLQLGVTNFEQLKYVKKEDLLEIGMPLPLTRMLLDKYRKKAGYTKIPFTSKRIIKAPNLMSNSHSQPKTGIQPFQLSKSQSRQSWASSDRTAMIPGFRGSSVPPGSGNMLTSGNMEPVLLCDDDLTNFELIGQGHFAKVYKALLRGQTRVAVKELKPGNTSGSIESLMKEVRVMLSVRHTNVIHFHGIVLDKNMRSSSTSLAIRLVFEYANLGSLDTYLRNKKPKLTVQMLWMFCQQILLGLAFLHERRLLHRDIAARNILVFDSELVKLADFGLSKFLPDESYDSYTAESAVMPVAWSAPESLKYKRYSAASDIYMFGVTCWEIFSFADHPRPRLTANEMLVKLENGEVLPQHDFCPDNIYNLVLSCCSFAAAERPDTHTLVVQWGNHRPKMLTAIKGCSNAGKLHFEKGDQIFVLSEPLETDAGQIMKGQNKRTFGVGYFPFSLVQSDHNNHKSIIGSSKSKQTSKSTSAAAVASSSATSSAQPSPHLSNQRAAKQSAVPNVGTAAALAAKSVLVHVTQPPIVADECSAWDSDLYETSRAETANTTINNNSNNE